MNIKFIKFDSDLDELWLTLFHYIWIVRTISVVTLFILQKGKMCI